MIGGLVHEKRVRLSDPAASQERHALPAATEFAQCLVAKFRRNGHFLEHDVDAPALGVQSCRVERRGDKACQALAKGGDRHFLGHKADGEAARAGDVALAQLGLSRHGAQQCTLATPIGSNKTNMVTVGDDEIEIGEEKFARAVAGIFEADRAHDIRSLDRCRIERAPLPSGRRLARAKSP
ncbi:hypothetical protein D3C87_1555450 [compost metagenome]